MSTLPLRLLLLALAAAFSVPAVAQSWSLLYTLEHPDAGTYSNFGRALIAAGDLDGDGIDDLAVAAQDSGSVYYGRGRVYFFSGVTGSLLYDVTSPGSFSAFFGLALASIGDINGDGVPEVLVGAGDEFFGPSGGSGRAYMFSGTSGDPLRVVSSPATYAGVFGASVAGTGDLDSDGVPDYAVGEPGQAGGGRAYLFSGATGDTLRSLRSPMPEPTGEFGQALAAIGDTDGDGVLDIIVAAPFEGTVGVTEGRLYLFSGATGALLHTIHNPTGLLDQVALAPVDDLTGDGIPDLIFGTPEGAFGSGEEGYPLFVGRVHVVSGATGSIVRTLRSPNEGTLRRQGSTFGEALAIVGDEDGDGIAEFAVGEPYAGGNGQTGGGGQVHVFSGAAGASPLTTLVNPARSDPSLRAFDFGRSLAALRMADGSVRLAVASADQRADDPGGQTFGRGRVYVYSRFPVASSPSSPAQGLSVSVSPNPARSSATLALHLAEASSVRIAVVDALGRVVRRLDAGSLAAGPHRLSVDVAGLAPGVYVVRLAAGDGAAASARLVVGR